ncbi:hypothetical protein SLOPH_1735, partial [Spraguea lophii 42_110]
MIVIHTKTDSFELEELPLDNGFEELLDFLSTQDVILSDQHRLAVLYHQHHLHANAIQILNLAIEKNVLIPEEIEKLNLILLSLYIELYFKDHSYYNQCNKLFQKLENTSKENQPILNICKGYFFLRTHKYDISKFLFSGQTYPLAVLGLSLINLLYNNNYNGDNILLKGLDRFYHGDIKDAVKMLEEEYIGNKNALFYLIRLSHRYRNGIIKYYLENDKKYTISEIESMVKGDAIELSELPDDFKHNDDFKVTMINFYIDRNDYEDAEHIIKLLREEEDREYFLGKLYHLKNNKDEALKHYKKSYNIYAKYSMSRIQSEEFDGLKDIDELHEFYSYLQIKNNNISNVDTNKLSGNFKAVVDVILNESINPIEAYKKYKKLKNNDLVLDYVVENNKAYFLDRIRKITSPYEQSIILESNDNINDEIKIHITNAMELYSKIKKEYTEEEKSITLALKYNKAKIEENHQILEELSHEDNFYLLNYCITNKKIKNITDKNIIGYILYKEKKYEEALKEIKRETNLFALILKGTIYFELKDLKRSLSIFINVLKKENYCFYAANMIGILLSTKDPNKSKIIFQKLSTIDKNIRKNLGIILYKLEEYDKSYYYFKRSIPLTDRIFSDIANKLKEKKEGKEIIEEIR